MWRRVAVVVIYRICWCCVGAILSVLNVCFSPLTLDLRDKKQVIMDNIMDKYQVKWMIAALEKIARNSDNSVRALEKIEESIRSSIGTFCLIFVITVVCIGFALMTNEKPKKK